MSTPANEVLDLIDSWRDEMVDFACRLVATPSPTPPGDERAVAQVIVAQLRSLGLTDITIAAARPERPNVLCRISGSGDARADEGTRPALLLNAHLDTKPIGDAASRWEIDPHTPTIRDGKLYGLGAIDMKAAIAAIVYAGAAIARASRGSPNALRGDLILALSADEEGGSAFGARYLTRDMIINGHTCVPLFVQEAGIAALRGPQDCVAAMRAEYHARRDLVVEGLNAIPGITCTTPVGAFYVLPGIFGLGVNKARSFMNMLLDSGVAALPGTDFGRYEEGHFRISYATAQDKLAEGLRRIRAAVEHLHSYR